jgi:formylmethanofuran dehydrogenase subunit C
MSNCNENQQVIQNDWYRFECGTKSFANGDIELCLSTPTQQGINMYKNGNCDFCINGTLKEVSGFNVKSGHARIIEAVNGDIHIKASNGTITLEARNIRLVGVDGVEGEITLQASKNCNINAPTVSAQGTNISLAASSKVQVAGAAAASLVGGASATIDSGTDADSSSVMGKILKALEDFKKFFSSICAD